MDQSYYHSTDPRLQARPVVAGINGVQRVHVQQQQWRSMPFSQSAWNDMKAMYEEDDDSASPTDYNSNAHLAARGLPHDGLRPRVTGGEFSPRHRNPTSQADAIIANWLGHDDETSNYRRGSTLPPSATMPSPAQKVASSLRRTESNTADMPVHPVENRREHLVTKAPSRLQREGSQSVQIQTNVSPREPQERMQSRPRQSCLRPMEDDGFRFPVVSSPRTGSQPLKSPSAGDALRRAAQVHSWPAGGPKSLSNVGGINLERQSSCAGDFHRLVSPRSVTPAMKGVIEHWLDEDTPVAPAAGRNSPKAGGLAARRGCNLQSVSAANLVDRGSQRRLMVDSPRTRRVSFETNVEMRSLD